MGSPRRLLTGLAVGICLLASAPSHAACLDELRALGVRYRPWPVRPVRLDDRRTCAVAEGVMMLRGRSGVRWSKPPRVSCVFAQRVVRFEEVMQDEARRAFGRPVTHIQHLGTFACRTMAAYPDWVSEHASANAIDIASFTLRGGRKVVVENDWIATPRPANTPAAAFLRSLARRLYDEAVFSVVLTPSFDRHHRNHFHLDGADYRVDGT